MWLTNLRLVLPDRVLACGSVRIEGERIAEISDGPVPEAWLDAGGLTALPGFVDIHGDMLERDLQPRPKVEIPIDIGVYELDKRLAAAGITTAYAAISLDWPNGSSLRSSERARRIIHTLNELRPALLTDFLVHVRFEITVPEAGHFLTEFLNASEVHLVSLTDHTPGQGQYRDIERFIHMTRDWRKHREGVELSEADIRAHIEAEQSRPKAWDIVQDIAQIARTGEIPLASHDDDTVDKVELMASLGAHISEFPVTLEAAQAARERGMHVVMGAPNALRGASHSHNLSAQDGIRAGVVDTLASDYFPAAMLHAMWTVVDKGLLPLHEAAKLVSANPADGVGLSDRGELSVGKLADLVLVETVGRPRVRATLRRGLPIYWDGRMAELVRAGTDPQMTQIAPI